MDRQPTISEVQTSSKVSPSKPQNRNPIKVVKLDFGKLDKLFENVKVEEVGERYVQITYQEPENYIPLLSPEMDKKLESMPEEVAEMVYLRLKNQFDQMMIISIMMSK